MVAVAWGKGMGRRIVGPYVWEKENGWIQDVDHDWLLELLTNVGFRLVEEPDLERVPGIGPATAEALLLLGVSTVAQLRVADAAELAAGLHFVGPAKVRKWQVSACLLYDTEEE